MRARVSAAALAAFLALPAATEEPSSARSLSIEDSERLAFNNSAELLAAEQDIIIARERVHEAQFLFLPEIGLQASATKYDSRYPFALAPEFRSILLFPSKTDNIYSGRAYLIHTLYAGGRNLNLLRVAQTALQQAQSQYEAVKMDSAYRARSVFFELLLAQERLSAVTERLKPVERSLAQDYGGWERVEAEGIASTLRARQAQARRDVALAGLEFRKTLNIELDTPVRAEGLLETKPVEVDLDQAVVWAMELRPELQSEIYKAQREDLGVRLALSRRIPTLVLESNYEVTNHRFPLIQNNWDATIGLRLPFSFDFGAQLKQRRAEKRQGEIKRAEIQDRVRLEVRQAHAELAFWQEEWPRREQEYARLQRLAASAPQDRGGLAGLRAQAELLQAQDRTLSSIKEHILAKARLERAVGKALQE